MFRVFWLVVVVAFGAPCIAQSPVLEAKPGGDTTRAAQAARNAILPKGVRRYLKEKLPDYRPVAATDYGAIWFDTRREYNAPNMENFNWTLRADFDGNGTDDYAILLRGAADGDLHALVVVRATDNGWTHDVLDSYRWPPHRDSDVRTTSQHEDRPQGTVIRTVPPGINEFVITDGLEPESIPLDRYGDPVPTQKALFLPSIVSSVLETCSADQYYWEKGRWHSVYIGL